MALRSRAERTDIRGKYGAGGVGTSTDPASGLSSVFWDLAGQPIGQRSAETGGAVTLRWRKRLGRPSAGDRAIGESPVLQQSVVEDDRAGNSQINGEFGWDADDVPAAREHGGR